MQTNHIRHPRVRWNASCFSLWPHLVWVQPNHDDAQDFERCIPYFAVSLLHELQLNHWNSLGFGDMHRIVRWGPIWCECSQLQEFLRFGEMHPAFSVVALICYDCNQNHSNAEGSVRCICFSTIALIGVNAINPKEFLGSAEIHHVCCCSLAWMQPNRGIHRA